MRNVALSALLLTTIAGLASAETRWTMVRTPALTVIGDQSPAALHDVAVETEQFRTMLGGLFGRPAPPLPLPTHFFVLGNRRSAMPFLPIYEGRPALVAGFFTRGLDYNAMLLALDGQDEAAPQVYHDFTHALLAPAVRGIPLWLGEGLAEYYSTYSLAKGGKSGEVGKPISSHVKVLRDRYLPIVELINIDRQSDLYSETDRRSILYAESWALVHYLLTEVKDGPTMINAYAGALAAGAPPLAAFRNAFRTTPEELDKQLQPYARRGTFTARRFTIDDARPAPVISAPRAMSDGEANAWLGDLQRRLGREEEAAKRIEEAAKNDPAAAATHLALGLLRIGRGADVEGFDALKRAADLAPGDFTVQFMRAYWLARSNAANLKAIAPAAIPLLQKASELNEESAEAYVWLAQLQKEDPATLDAARVSAESAILLAPGQATYRILWADIRTRQGAIDDARNALQPIAAGTWDPVASRGARAQLDVIERLETRLAAAAAEAEAARKVTEVPDSDLAARKGLVLDLRAVQPGEERELGELMRVECAKAEVRFEVKTADRTIVATVPKLEDVELISYTNDPKFSVTCGPRPAPERVFITWKPDAPPLAKRDGVAVAVEFLPKDYVP